MFEQDKDHTGEVDGTSSAIGGFYSLQAIQWVDVSITGSALSGNITRLNSAQSYATYVTEPKTQNDFIKWDGTSIGAFLAYTGLENMSLVTGYNYFRGNGLDTIGTSNGLKTPVSVSMGSYSAKLEGNRLGVEVILIDGEKILKNLDSKPQDYDGIDLKGYFGGGKGSGQLHYLKETLDAPKKDGPAIEKESLSISFNMDGYSFELAGSKVENPGFKRIKDKTQWGAAAKFNFCD